MRLERASATLCHTVVEAGADATLPKQPMQRQALLKQTIFHGRRRPSAFTAQLVRAISRAEDAASGSCRVSSASAEPTTCRNGSNRMAAEASASATAT
jgi:hypothetical protein